MSPSAESSEKAREAESLDAETTYEVIRREGLHELDRASSALFWSGLAGGLSMGFSFLAEGLLRAHLPDADWRPLVTRLGYSVGFLIVILGSQQLFTENTLTPIVPLLHQWSARRLRNVGRLWGVVLMANILGALLFATALARFDIVEPVTMHALDDLAREALAPGAPATGLHAIYAGWLIALMVWMLPGAESGKITVVIIMTYLVGLGGFAHVIAGSTEVLYAVMRGDIGAGRAVFGYIFPTLIGNVLGGLTMVAALNHAQATSGD
ncbi:MAG: hypothetical protein JWM95_3023 [Gemmatimonadetes bacterium]|nr:hypothetical protein [Gemmatimonadota bacterium]